MADELKAVEKQVGSTLNSEANRVAPKAVTWVGLHPGIVVAFIILVAGAVVFFTVF